MNEVTKHEQHLPAAEADKNPFEKYASDADRNKIVGRLLRFRKGRYFAGIDEQEIPIGTELIAIMDELHVGWTKWGGGRPVDGVQGKIAEGYVPPRRADLGDPDREEWERDPETDVARDPWQPTNSLILKELLSNELYTLVTSSKGGIGAIASLSGAYGKHLRSKPDDYPVIVLGASSYKHSVKTRGTIDIPVLEIVEWTNKAAALEALAGVVEEVEEPRAGPRGEPPSPSLAKQIADKYDSPLPDRKPAYKPEGRKPRF